MFSSRFLLLLFVCVWLCIKFCLVVFLQSHRQLPNITPVPLCLLLMLCRFLYSPLWHLLFSLLLIFVCAWLLTNFLSRVCAPKVIIICVIFLFPYVFCLCLILFCILHVVFIVVPVRFWSSSTCLPHHAYTSFDYYFSLAHLHHFIAIHKPRLCIGVPGCLISVYKEPAQHLMANWRYRCCQVLWGSDFQVPRSKYSTVMHEDRALLDWLLLLEKYGVTVVEAAPTRVGAINDFIERLGVLKPTHYGWGTAVALLALRTAAFVFV